MRLSGNIFILPLPPKGSLCKMHLVHPETHQRLNCISTVEKSKFKVSSEVQGKLLNVSPCIKKKNKLNILNIQCYKVNISILKNDKYEDEINQTKAKLKTSKANIKSCISMSRLQQTVNSKGLGQPTHIGYITLLVVAHKASLLGCPQLSSADVYSPDFSNFLGVTTELLPSLSQLYALSSLRHTAWSP